MFASHTSVESLGLNLWDVSAGMSLIPATLELGSEGQGLTATVGARQGAKDPVPLLLLVTLEHLHALPPRLPTLNHTLPRWEDQRQVLVFTPC